MTSEDEYTFKSGRPPGNGFVELLRIVFDDHPTAAAAGIVILVVFLVLGYVIFGG